MKASSFVAFREVGSKGRYHYGSPSHLVAARTVAAETWGYLTVPAQMYRMMEFIGNFCLLFVMMWVVWAAWALIPLVLFWYIPAAIRTRSFIFSPIIFFTVDDFSLLQLHPTPRSARIIYMVAVARVFALLLAFPLVSKWSPLPDWLHNIVVAKDFASIFHEKMQNSTVSTHSGIQVNYFEQMWFVFAFILGSITALWLFITIGMLVVTQCDTKLRIAKSLRGELDHQLLRDVHRVTEEIHKVSSLQDPSMCKRGLQALRQRHPKLQILGFVGAWSPLFLCIFHLCLDISNTVTMATTPTRFGPLGLIMASVLGLTIVITLVMMFIRTHGRLWRVFQEAYLTQRRGLYTPDYLAIIRVDKGVQLILALAIKIFQLPYSARTTYSLVVGLISIVGGVITAGGFIFQEFDLGTEMYGRDVDSQQVKQAIAAHHRGAPGNHEQYPWYGATSMLPEARAQPINSSSWGYGATELTSEQASKSPLGFPRLHAFAPAPTPSEVSSAIERPVGTGIHSHSGSLHGSVEPQREGAVSSGGVLNRQHMISSGYLIEVRSGRFTRAAEPVSVHFRSAAF